MPIKVKNEAGEEIDAFTQEEFDAKTVEETQRVEAEKQSELDALQAEKVELEEKLEKAANKELNFEKVRKKADGKELEVSEEVKKQLDEISKRIDAVALRPVEDIKTDFIKTKIGEDKEKVALFNHFFNRLGADAKTKEEVLKASQEALTLVMGGEYKPNTDSKMFSTDTSKNYRETPTGSVSEEAKEMGKIFGNTSKELEEYQKKKKGIS